MRRTLQRSTSGAPHNQLSIILFYNDKIIICFKIREKASPPALFAEVSPKKNLLTEDFFYTDTLNFNL